MVSASSPIEWIRNYLYYNHKDVQIYLRYKWFFPQVLAVNNSLFSWSDLEAKNVLFLKLPTWRGKKNNLVNEKTKKLTVLFCSVPTDRTF